MSGNKISFNSVPLVDVDEEGIYKYVLIKLYAEETNPDVDPNFKMLVRGYKSAEFHADIYDPFSDLCESAGLHVECVGGGRIEHDKENRLFRIYGYSIGFGRADHAETKRILQTKYPDYEYEISNDGY